MAEEKTSKKDEIRREYLAPATSDYDNKRDYEYGFTLFTIKGKLVVKGPVIFQGPELADVAALADTPAFQFMQKRYGLDAADVFKQALGRIATGPNYAKAEDEAGCEAALAEAQKLADEFKVGQRRAASASVQAKAKKVDAWQKRAEELGFESVEEMMEAVKAKKKKA